MGKPDVCVIGAGVIGLSTAVRLQEDLPDLPIMVIADKFTPNTTSDGAAGISRYWNKSNPLLSKWAVATFKQMQNLHQAEGPLTGIQQFVLLDINDKETNYEVDVDYRKLSAEELKKLYPGKNYKYGNSFLTFIAECNLYLPWLMHRFKSRGGTILERHVHSFDEIADNYDVIVNCSGLGARRLANDESIRPNRGQVLRLHAPWIKIGTFDNIDWIHILPRSNDVVIGGVHRDGSWDESLSSQDRNYIWEKACKIEPSLKYATVVSEWVGLRPARPSVRLERQDAYINGRKLKIVHNYGHGGFGICVHWGCAVDASALVQQCLQEIQFNSKL
ncbi:D-aspartate oxidase-like [Anneissia japonica]|uniref:D-aspartate oxidase-like n=1 Tax=Anneissia japonica TaxID=1529436 RepID=UPI0014254CBA|nr:D-aspartate oxidase-like [Anneissia japonica]XP_033108997.1 D-aspartate oxidase-like [Anneissia japonica]